MPPRKNSRGARFLAEIDSVTPWSKLHKLIEPFYPKISASLAQRPAVRLLMRSVFSAESA